MTMTAELSQDWCDRVGLYLTAVVSPRSAPLTLLPWREHFTCAGLEGRPVTCRLSSVSWWAPHTLTGPLHPTCAPQEWGLVGEHEIRPEAQEAFPQTPWGLPTPREMGEESQGLREEGLHGGRGTRIQWPCRHERGTAPGSGDWRTPIIRGGTDSAGQSLILH